MNALAMLAGIRDQHSKPIDDPQKKIERCAQLLFLTTSSKHSGLITHQEAVRVARVALELATLIIVGELELPPSIKSDHPDLLKLYEYLQTTALHAARFKTTPEIVE